MCSPSQVFFLSMSPLRYFKWDPTWQSSGMEGRKGKEKASLKVRGFFWFALPTACKRYALSDASDPFPWPHLSAISSVEEEHLDISLVMYHLQTISHWQDLKIMEVGVFPSPGTHLQKVVIYFFIPCNHMKRISDSEVSCYIKQTWYIF